MANAFTRSWDVTKTTFEVMKKDRELLIYPILSGIFSLIFLVLMVFPSIFAIAMGNQATWGTMQYILIFVAYFGIAFIAIFFNTCVVYTAKTRFEGGNATLKSSFQFALSRIGVIIQWALVSATVGLLLRILENLAQRAEGVGRIIAVLIVRLVGMAWAVVTVFVIPSIVYRGNGPKDAIKDSVAVLKKTWGESLIRYLGLGFVEFVVMLVGILVLAPIGFIGLTSGSIALFVTALIIGILWLVLVGLVFGVANAVFNTALYVYGSTGKVPSEYSEGQLTEAFKPREKTRR